MTKTPRQPADTVKMLVELRAQLVSKAFDSRGVVQNPELAEAVWKINSCLYERG